MILRQHFLLDECNFLSENKLVAEAGKHHIGKQKGEQLFTVCQHLEHFIGRQIASIHFLDAIEFPVTRPPVRKWGNEF